MAWSTALLEKIHRVTTSDGAALALTEVRLREEADPPSSGAAFLMMHGFAQNRLSFLNSPLPAALLERGARVFVGELRGHGRSRQARSHPREWGLAHHLREDLPALVGAAAAISGAGRVHLIGHSMSGMLGYAFVSRAPDRLASLTTFGAPVVLGTGRPLVRAGAHVMGRVVQAGQRSIPMDLVLRLYSRLAVKPKATGLIRLLQDLTCLANPDAADPSMLRDILSLAEPEARAVFLDFTRIATSGRATIDGVDLVESVADCALPIAAVVSDNDLFAPPVSIHPLVRGRGPRRIFELQGCSHVDALMGYKTSSILDDLWAFLERPARADRTA